jgi:hypothetical protein
MAWHAKQTVRSIYDITDPNVARNFVTQLGFDLQDESCPPEVRSLGRTLRRWLVTPRWGGIPPVVRQQG